MLDQSAVSSVDKLGEVLRYKLEDAANGKWEKPFEFGKATKSDYWRGKVSASRNWVQLNGRVYGHPSYDNWKIQARFSHTPKSGFWQKKQPYKYNRSPQEWSLGGSNVWAISYEDLLSLLQKASTEDVVAKLLEDLKDSWTHLNK
jgi:hypothetical protein